jgi:CheY-like chemotaxis protein
VGDPIRLRQILLNLIGNAIKFTQEGEIAVSVDCKKGQTADRASGGRNGEDISEEKPMVLQFSVKDTGIGIADADQAKIFDPFTQVDASTTRRYGGTGLGLAISASLVKMMGGSIWIESKLNQGSTFHFTVQLLLQSDSPEQSHEDISRLAKETPPAEVRPLRILLAEDNLANQKMAAYLLEKQGHGVEIIDNGRDAVELAKSREYDIVLMDVQMPTMDGFEATAAIRALPDKAKAHLPIVAMTAHSMKGDKERCLAAGMDGYLTKPICREDLFAVLAKFGNNGKNHH